MKKQKGRPPPTSIILFSLNNKCLGCLTDLILKAAFFAVHNIAHVCTVWPLFIMLKSTPAELFCSLFKQKQSVKKTDVLLDSIVRHGNRRAIFPKKELDTWWVSIDISKLVLKYMIFLGAKSIEVSIINGYFSKSLAFSPYTVYSSLNRAWKGS